MQIHRSGTQAVTCVTAAINLDFPRNLTRFYLPRRLLRELFLRNSLRKLTGKLDPHSHILTHLQSLSALHE